MSWATNWAEGGPTSRGLTHSLGESSVSPAIAETTFPAECVQELLIVSNEGSSENIRVYVAERKSGSTATLVRAGRQVVISNCYGALIQEAVDFGARVVPSIPVGHCI